ncbi:MAG: FxsA family protein [bacterium]
MFFKLFVIFTLVPVVELVFLIKVGGVIGAFNTIVIVLLTAAVGAYLVKLEGISVLYRLQNNIRMGIFPAEELIDGVMVLIAGALLLTPGFVTDLLGFLFVFPSSRAMIKLWAKAYIRKRVNYTRL